MLIDQLEEQLLERNSPIRPGQARELLDLAPGELPRLLSLTHRIRLRESGPEVELESILSAKTGGCPEDCAFCSQSRHWPGTVSAAAFIETNELVKAASASQEKGATEFCIVLAIRGPDDQIMQQVLGAVEALRASTDLEVACSLGILTKAQAQALAQAGVHRYNHNLETARSYFDQICSTHTWEERQATCQLVKEAGMQLCCGGIFGMGETLDQRVEFAFELAGLQPVEVPVNFLNPRPGTPLAGRSLVAPADALKTIAMLRLVLPTTILRYAGGREVTLGELQPLGLFAGINALIIGNYLTTLGRDADQDLAMLSGLGMPVKTAPPERNGRRGDFDPPRRCPACGARLKIQVLPDTFEASCPKCGRLQIPAAGASS